MDSLVGIVILVGIALHAILFLLVQIRGKQVRTGRGWLSLTILLSLLALASYFFPAELRLADKIGRGYASALTVAATLTLFGALVFKDVTNKQPRLWLLMGVIWIVGMVIAALTAQTVTVGQPEWLMTALSNPTAAGLITLGGLTIMGIVLLGTTFYGFYAASLPEIANRALFWVIDCALMMMGVVLTISGTDILILIGAIALTLGVIGAVYAQLSYRVLDIRRELALALRTLLLVLFTAVFLFIALYIANQIQLDDNTRRTLVLAALALAVAGIYVPARQLIELIIKLLFRRSLTDPTEATRRYSQQVSTAVELDQLADVARQTLNQVMRVRRSGLILIYENGINPKVVDLQAIASGGSTDTRPFKTQIAKANPIYHRLAVEQAPLSQFDLEFSPDFKEISEDERQIFRDLQMGAYAPIIVENGLIGILACGPKNNDAPYLPNDLELLATMANQTGIALRNARLVADLRRLNENMKSLNAGLGEAKVQMERLDSVKSDFVTIASHELRTPLAQIRGYTDIIDALNEQGMLDRDQMGGMVSNLRKATERMEELISAMLDVSQLDVDAMDLRFTQASLESVMRMAIEPLTDAIKQRKLTLSARGLRGLPTIQADMQRLVQAFRNVVINSIKFTPDGGRIEITASLQAADKLGDGIDHILISISDTGVGIDRENLELIFRKFYRAYDPGLHSTGTYKFLGAGPGLGLTIAKGVIEGHGGKIWAESAGHNLETFPGTTFHVLLPVSPPEDARRVLAFEGQATPQSTSDEATLMRTQM